jgi:hydrogenase/urease accessory protein HupE
MSHLLRHCVAALILVTLANTAHGHGLVPMLLKLEQIDDLHLRVSLKSGVTVAQTPTPVFPETCTPSAPQRTMAKEAHWTIWQLRCEEPPHSISLPGLGEYQAVAQYHAPGEPTHSSLLDAHSPVFQFKASGDWLGTLIRTAHSGIIHLLAGWDHLLFVIGLTLWLRRGKPLVLAITSFTLGHSLTLALAASGIIRFPVTLAEIAIAASLLAMAFHLNRGTLKQPSRATVLLLPLGFGLLHGLGFANVLNTQGLSGNDLIITLLGFNLGLELGQLLCVAAVLLVMFGMKHHIQRLQGIAVYSIGSMAVFWMWERALLLAV